MLDFIRSCRVSGMLFLCAFGAASVAGADEMRETLLDEARVMIARPDGAVRKWSYTPTVTVIHDADYETGEVTETVDLINANSGLRIGTGPNEPVTYIAWDAFWSDQSRHVRFGLVHEEGHHHAVQSSIALTQVGGHVGTSNIMVFASKAEERLSHAALMSGVLSDAKVRRNLRAMAGRQGGGECYFQLLSNADSLHVAYVFILVEENGRSPESCLYEEVMQTMGILRDAEGSVHFSFDDRHEAKDPTYDLALLRAIYDPSITSEDPVEAVLDRFAAELDLLQIARAQ
ncbi:DUF2927 domain-containing protein [Aestuariibius insulae]|uniref:DUF2927 domain-containing protein n=1 Tax=Aestuariibius insulae TaxID=2058287 RepID=UPI00345E7C2E